LALDDTSDSPYSLLLLQANTPSVFNTAVVAAAAAAAAAES
jgi:hypothetical protein